MTVPQQLEQLATENRHEQILRLFDREVGAPAIAKVVGYSLGGVHGVLKRNERRLPGKGENMRGTGDYTEWLPWPIKREHRNNRVAYRLRLYGREQATLAGVPGVPELNARERGYLAALKKDLDAARDGAPYGVFVCGYQPLDEYGKQRAPTDPNLFEVTPRKRGEVGYVLRPDGRIV